MLCYIKSCDTIICDVALCYGMLAHMVLQYIIYWRVMLYRILSCDTCTIRHIMTIMFVMVINLLFLRLWRVCMCTRSVPKSAAQTPLMGGGQPWPTRSTIHTILARERGRSRLGVGRCSIVPAPALAAEPMFEVPVLSAGSRLALGHRLHGLTRRHRSSKSEPWAPSFGPHSGGSNIGPAMDTTPIIGMLERDPLVQPASKFGPASEDPPP